MPRTRLTAESVRRLSALDGKRTEFFDDELPGFSLRVTPSGGKSFCVLYRRGRRLRRYTLGKYPVLGLASARVLARKALAEAALGGDPGGWKPRERRAQTFEELCRDYLERHARPHKRSWREDERRIRKLLLPLLAHRPAEDIRRSEIRAVLEPILERSASIEANRTHALFRKIFNWAVSLDLVERNPASGLPRPARERMRFHVMSAEDLRRFWGALEEERPLARAALRLMLLTAQRGGEVLRIRRRDIDRESVWTIPAEVSKNGLPHRVPLSEPALVIVEELYTLAGRSQWLFPSSKGAGDRPWSGIQKAIGRVRRRAGIELRGHDLRRTAASSMTSMGIPRLVVARILNHVEVGVIAVYDRHSYDREKREALDAWAQRLWKILA